MAFCRKARRHGAVEISAHQSTCRAANALLSRAGVTFGAFEELLQRSFVPLALAFKDPRQDRRREPEYTGHVEMHIADEPGSVGTRRLDQVRRVARDLAERV